MDKDESDKPVAIPPPADEDDPDEGSLAGKPKRPSQGGKTFVDP